MSVDLSIYLSFYRSTPGVILSFCVTPSATPQRWSVRYFARRCLLAAEKKQLSSSRSTSPMKLTATC